MLVLDTGPLLALLNAEDEAHESCLRMVEAIDEDLVVPAPILVELDYWIRRRLGVEVWATFVGELTEGRYQLHSPDQGEIRRAADLEVTYADLRLGFVDASVIACCERLGEPKVATLDHRDFSVVRPAHVAALRLLPD